MIDSLKNIASIIGAGSVETDVSISQLLTDSRKIITPAESIFFALQGPRRNGHEFIPLLYEKGVRFFVVSKKIDAAFFPEAVFLHVANTLDALQKVAAEHRGHFLYPVIGITGSNGKTIVKEWLWQVLSPDFKIVRNPKSYNSQIGVPLSVWQMSAQHNLAIFEAGISEPGEMDKLQSIIQPTIGIITNIGEAHSRGFRDQQQKAEEKLRLLKHAEVIIFCNDQSIIKQAIQKSAHSDNNNRTPRKIFSWGRNRENALCITSITK